MWDDLINDSIEEATHVHALLAAFDQITSTSDEVALWYAGFPDEIPIFSGRPSEFGRMIAAQLAAGELEPAVRMIVNGPFAGPI